MEICRYCNTVMLRENATNRDKSYDFFYNCPNCKSIYEGTKDKNNHILKSRCWNSQMNKFESINNY